MVTLAAGTYFGPTAVPPWPTERFSLRRPSPLRAPQSAFASIRLAFAKINPLFVNYPLCDDKSERMIVYGTRDVDRVGMGRPKDEEQELKSGERFRKLYRQVPRWLPSFSPRVVAGCRQSQWDKGLRLESVELGLFRHGAGFCDHAWRSAGADSWWLSSLASTSTECSPFQTDGSRSIRMLRTLGRFLTSTAPDRSDHNPLSRRAFSSCEQGEH